MFSYVDILDGSFLWSAVFRVWGLRPPPPSPSAAFYLSQPDVTYVHLMKALWYRMVRMIRFQFFSFPDRKNSKYFAWADHPRANRKGTDDYPFQKGPARPLLPAIHGMGGPPILRRTMNIHIYIYICIYIYIHICTCLH